MSGVPHEVIELVKRYEDHRSEYESSGYNEAQVCREFVEPLFAALGWDVRNEKGFSEAYKDVIHEDAIKTARGSKAPDYSFRIGGNRKFFVEAKRPSIDIGVDVNPSIQVRSYAWTAKLAVCVLTNFRQLAIYDGNVRPKSTDHPSTARVLWVEPGDIARRWDEVSQILAPEFT